MFFLALDTALITYSWSVSRTSCMTYKDSKTMKNIYQANRIWAMINDEYNKKRKRSTSKKQIVSDKNTNSNKNKTMKLYNWK